MSDQELQQLESQFPALSGEAFAAARQKVREAGQTVMQSEGGFLVQVFPDGRKEVLKRIEPPTPVKAGTLIAIR